MKSIFFLYAIYCLISSCAHAQTPVEAGSITLGPNVRGSAAMGSGPYRPYQVFYDQYQFNLSIPDNYEKGSGAFFAGVTLEYFTASNPSNISVNVYSLLNGRIIDSYNTIFSYSTSYFSVCIMIAPGDSYSTIIVANGSHYSFSASVYFNWVNYETAVAGRCYSVPELEKMELPIDMNKN